MNSNLSGAIEQLVQQAPRSWLDCVCAELQSWPATASAANMQRRIPPTYNGDLARCLHEVLRLCDGQMSWTALGFSVLLCADLYAKWQAEEHGELLWAGPSPANGVPARRIDEALYDLISSAEREILLITFAAHKIQRLAETLAEALRRGVRIRLLRNSRRSLNASSQLTP